MKTCPECQTVYEDHVDHCLADGAALVESKASTKSGTPVPVGRGAAPPSNQEEPQRGSGARWLLLLIPFLLFGLVAVAVVGFLLIPSGEPTAPPVDVAPTQRPSPTPATPTPTPTPTPVARPQPKLVGLVSSPKGATVTEGGEIVCTTPCNIQHAPEATLPRTFQLTLDGHVKTVFELTSTDDGPYLVDLDPVRRTTTRPKPRPSPGPAPADSNRPSLGRDR